LSKQGKENKKSKEQKPIINHKEEGMFIKLNRHRNEKGFTLIELMIVVVIIGILAALAIPRFMASTTRSKQSEAKEILKQIYTMERAYRQEYDTYWGNGISADAANPITFARIGVEIQATARYTYTLTAAQHTFTCVADVANPGLDDDVAPDTWQIDEDGDLQCTSDDAVI
jgi:prepilin-type N-terminal cleavage/methylation domain-containing protein